MSNFFKPEEIFPSLFHDVQLAGIFSDSKSFADSVPTCNIKTIEARYLEEKMKEGFSLRNFVDQNFYFPSIDVTDFQLGSEKEGSVHIRLRKHIEQLWEILEREKDGIDKISSRIPLPFGYVVPGGRFQEIYYWDSYFTMLGLQVAGKNYLIRQMIDNFAFFIDTFGFIPNGNRSYFLSRSQPPFFSLMVASLPSVEARSKYLKQLIQEHFYWETSCRSVHFDMPTEVNVYFDAATTPRPESYKEDVELGEGKQSEKELFLHLRSACASGWDFSSRWCNEKHDLSTIVTNQIVPLDLNCLLFHLESQIAELILVSEVSNTANIWQDKADARKDWIQKNLWDELRGCYFDFNLSSQSCMDDITAAIFFPLFFNIPTQEQVNRLIPLLEKELLQPGGWRTTNLNSGQQWDAPNGWAPLQWMAFIGLKNYGFNDLANSAANRWITLNEKVFDRTGKMMEKYNVEDLTLDAGGGEYPIQDGFGWTNGVYLALVDALEKSE